MRNKRGAALFMIGLLLGQVIMYCLFSKRMEQVYWEKEKYKVDLYEITEQMKQVQEDHDTLFPPVVQEIQLDIRFKNDAFVEPELKRHIYDLVKGLLGQEIQALPYPLVLNLLEERTVEFEKKAYQLDVEAVIIGETVIYYILAEKKESES